VAVTDEAVSFRWKDYRHGSQMRTLTLDVDEFLRRLLLHVLPKRFVRIRYFGFLAPRCRTRELAQCRQALAVASTPPNEPLAASTRVISFIATDTTRQLIRAQATQDVVRRVRCRGLARRAHDRVHFNESGQREV
jgi:Putative transposase